MITLIAGAHADEPVGPLNLYCFLLAYSQMSNELNLSRSKNPSRLKIFHINEHLEVSKVKLSSNEFEIMLDELSSWLANSLSDVFLQGQVQAWLSIMDKYSLASKEISVVAHMNPKGALINRSWWDDYCKVNLCLDTNSSDDNQWKSLLPLGLYLDERVRELPGEDIEFGFHKDALTRSTWSDQPPVGIRKEPWVVGQLWKEQLENLLESKQIVEKSFHISFHGMGFSAGPWFLLEREWDLQGRLDSLKSNLSQEVVMSGYHHHDVERNGEKGFWRLGKGFCSRPDSVSMRRHFEDLKDLKMAEKFQLSSMEFRRELQPGVFTAVSEMPLFTLEGVGQHLGPPDMRAEFYKLKISEWSLEMSMATIDKKHLLLEEIAQDAWKEGVRMMPLADQLHFQRLLFIESLKLA